jgi:hypothetical protein
MKRVGTTFGSHFSRTKRRVPPPCQAVPVCIHNLNHVSRICFSFYSSLVLLCRLCLRAKPVLAYPSPTPYRTRSVGLSTYVIKSFSSFCFVFSPNIFILFFSICFYFPPPGSCLSLFTFHCPFLVRSLCLTELPVSVCWV